MESSELAYVFNNFLSLQEKMEEPFFSYLLMLFHEMDVFSIPEVGSFIKVLHPAVRVGDAIQAPTEEFIYDYKEEHIKETQQFLMDRLSLSHKESKKLLDDISVHLFRYLDYVSHKLEIPGIGTLQHFPKNDTFKIECNQSIRLDTLGMEDMHLPKIEKEKKSWFEEIKKWIQRKK